MAAPRRRRLYRPGQLGPAAGRSRPAAGGAVDEAEAWYRARGLPPMIVIPGPLGAVTPDGGLAGDPLDALLAARGWWVRSVPVVVMAAGVGQVGGPGRSPGGPPGPGDSGA